MTVESLCRRVYEETRRFYAEKAPQLGDVAHGFRILYGPPVTNAPILFIGYQPGGKSDSASRGIRDGEHEGWPTHCDYATADWRLAARLRDIWPMTTLERSTGLNAIFFRSPSVTVWRRLSRELRDELEAFSLARAELITRALDPQLIVVIGLGTFDRLADGAVELRGSRRTLVKRGELWGTPAYGIVHISGARVSREDRSHLAQYFGVLHAAQVCAL